MRCLDHSMIFFLIAGTYTPFALLVLHGALATAILIVVWIGAIAGAIVESIWIDHPKWVAAAIYMSLGWVAVAAFPALWSTIGVGGSLLIAAGGLLYTAGAVVYATQGPWNSTALADKVPSAAWKTKPSWFIAVNDRILPADYELAIAKRINAKMTKLSSGHVPMLSQPRAVAAVIIDAANSARSLAANP
jgi:predicted membrane channel-forming protein YqfA (hemolysin III family)